MNNTMFDKPRLKEMQKFLNYLYTIGIQNDIYLNQHMVYRELSKYGLSDSNKAKDGDLLDNESLFYKWLDKSNKDNSISKGLRVFRDPFWEYFLQFVSNNSYRDLKKNKEYLKLYIPINYQNLYEGVNELFDYITNENINHLSKVSQKVRSDNVVVRLKKDDIDSAYKIINYVCNNKYLKNALNITNPFVPNINGIGIMQESGISYNNEMAGLISSYINKKINTKTSPQLKEFYEFFIKNNEKEEVKNAFDMALGKNDLSNIIEEDDYEKKVLLFEALTATYNKYGINQVIFALREAVNNNNFAYFTGEIYRAGLKSSLSREEIINFIKPYSSTNNVNNNLDEICYRIFNLDLQYKFDKACLVTLLKYGSVHLSSAIHRIISENNPSLFSRFSTDENDKTNYREVVISLGSYGVQKALIESLQSNGINYNNMNLIQIIDAYSTNLLNVQSNKNIRR